ncbi:MAG: response regulator [Chloroflexota bacterium]
MRQQVAFIIEDDEALRELFTEALQQAGFETEALDDGDVAMTRLAASKPDVIVLDLNLPHVSGQQILQHIRASTQLENTRVIVVSANHRLAESLRILADLVLIKPVSFSQLRDLAKRMYLSIEETLLDNPSTVR